MGKELEDFEVIVRTKTKIEAPRSATNFHMFFTFWGKELSEDFVVESIRVAEEELCEVTDVLKHITKITHEYHILETKNKLLM